VATSELAHSGCDFIICSEIRRAGSAGERDDVADIADAGHKHEHAFEAEAETRMRHGAVRRRSRYHQ